MDADKKSNEAKQHDKGKLEDGKKKLSIEMEQKKEELKAFQKSFHVSKHANQLIVSFIPLYIFSLAVRTVLSTKKVRQNQALSKKKIAIT